MKNVVLVNCFDTYEDRIELVYDYFKSKQCNITIIQSNFRHIKKIHRSEKKEDYIFVNSKPYNKNLSLSRLTSHYQFAKDAFKIVNNLSPDLLYVIVPPNSLCRMAAQYKKNNKDVKLVYDLIDLWPETMPIKKMKNFPPFSFWKLLRDKNIHLADYIITECDLYQESLSEVLKGQKTKTIYLAKKKIEVKSNVIKNTDKINICYLGSINNIIDIQKIKLVMAALNNQGPTILHIIGDGEKRDQLINEVEKTGCEVKFYGKIYDPQEKQKIFNECLFGLNIMKDTVCVGLTMKSIDYLQNGLPLLNNIQSDTTRIVEDYKIGYNICDTNIEDIAREISNLEVDDINQMKKSARKVFNEKFSEEAFKDNLNLVFKEIYSV